MERRVIQDKLAVGDKIDIGNGYEGIVLGVDESKGLITIDTVPAGGYVTAEWSSQPLSAKIVSTTDTAWPKSKKRSNLVRSEGEWKYE